MGCISVETQLRDGSFTDETLLESCLKPLVNESTSLLVNKTVHVSVIKSQSVIKNTLQKLLIESSSPLVSHSSNILPDVVASIAYHLSQ